MKPYEKTPAIRGGFNRATTDLAQVDKWWRKNKQYNIGIACNGVLVLDVDVKNGGDASFDELCAVLGAETFAGVPAVTTPGGRHFYYRQSSPPLQRRIKLLPGIDLLGKGGYAVAPPSVRENGSYVWRPDVDADQITPDDLPKFPSTVHEFLLRSHNPVAQAKSRSIVKPLGLVGGSRIGQGERNSRLMSVAGSLVANHIPYDALAIVIRATNESACVPPLQDFEVNAVLKSAKGFDQRFLDGKFIVPWLSSDLGTKNVQKRYDAMRLLVLLSKWARQNGTVDPPREQLTDLLKLSKRAFYEARELLEIAGAIVVHERGSSLSSIIVLQWTQECCIESDAA